MTRNRLYYENRIELLKNRGTDCSKIIAKLKRKLRLLDKS